VSTKAIREALDTLEAYADTDEDWRQHRAAMAGVEAIERAAKVLTQDRRDGVVDVRIANELLVAIAKDAP
jgi:hypothetical protein